MHEQAIINVFPLAALFCRNHLLKVAEDEKETALEAKLNKSFDPEFHPQIREIVLNPPWILLPR
jgi:hypothetical protein